jgi:hypothetical protein
VACDASKAIVIHMYTADHALALLWTMILPQVIIITVMVTDIIITVANGDMTMVLNMLIMKTVLIQRKSRLKIIMLSQKMNLATFGLSKRLVLVVTLRRISSVT